MCIFHYFFKSGRQDITVKNNGCWNTRWLRVTFSLCFATEYCVFFSFCFEFLWQPSCAVLLRILKTYSFPCDMGFLVWASLAFCFVVLHSCVERVFRPWMLLCMLTLHWDTFWYTGAALGAFWLAHPAQLSSDSQAVLTHRRRILCSHVPEHSLLTRPAELVH